MVTSKRGGMERARRGVVTVQASHAYGAQSARRPWMVYVNGARLDTRAGVGRRFAT